MALQHLRDAVSELAYLSHYAGCSLLGAVRRLPHVPEGHRRPVVLVPGFLGRNLSFKRLRDHLAERGHPVYVPDFGFQIGDIRRKSRELETFLEFHELEDCYLIGHSMGGWIALGMSEAGWARVRHFVTLGTAHHGAVASWLFPLLPAARQLRPGSPIQRRLLDAARQATNLTNIVAGWDEIAFPVRCCRLAVDREIDGVPGHVRLIMSRKALRMVGDLLDRLDAAPEVCEPVESTC